MIDGMMLTLLAIAILCGWVFAQVMDAPVDDDGEQGRRR